MGRKGTVKGFPLALLTAVTLAGLMIVYPGIAVVVFLIGLIGWFGYRISRRNATERRREKLRGYSLDELDQLSGSEFEEWVTEVLTAASMPSENIKHRGDFGVDVVTTVDGTRIGIQVKRYASSVGNSAVQEALAGSGYHQCSHAAVVTQSNFTRAARAQASRARVPVLLIDRENIHDMVRLMKELARS